MLTSQSGIIPALIVLGELKKRRPIFGNSFDPQYSYTEGQFRALYMRLNRLISQNKDFANKPVTLDNGQHSYFAMNKVSGKNMIYCVVLQQGDFSEDFIKNINSVAKRSGIYTAKRFFSEITSLQLGNYDYSKIDEMTVSQAISIIRNKVVSSETINEITPLLQIISTSEILTENIVFLKCMDGLDLFSMEYTDDQILDTTFNIANLFYINSQLDYAKELFIRIAEKASLVGRLALEITCRLKASELIKYLTGNARLMLELISPIDDGSLEVATQEEREQFYSTQGFCFAQLKDNQLAEDFHYMAVMISESETGPSIYVAESRAYLGFTSAKNYQPEISTREYLTAATIAQSNNDHLKFNEYTHLAAIQEIIWAKYLASAAIVANMNSQQGDAEFFSWQALKRLINSIGHADKSKRKSEIKVHADEIINMTRGIVIQTNSEYTLQTFNDLQNQLNYFIDGVLPSDQEGEMLNFLSTKISTMLPLPPPIMMLIANDGRLILGGEIGAENWDKSIMEHDDLFSGALSAIMAILSEVISDKNPLRMLDAGQTQIMIERSSVCIGALLVDRDLILIRRALKETLSFMEIEFPQLNDWDGYSINFSKVKPKVEEIFGQALRLINE